MTFDEFAIGMTETAQDVILEFTRKYFGKEPSELTNEEKHEIDCFGIYGCSDWLEDNKDN